MVDKVTYTKSKNLDVNHKPETNFSSMAYMITEISMLKIQTSKYILTSMTLVLL